MKNLLTLSLILGLSLVLVACGGEAKTAAPAATPEAATPADAANAATEAGSEAMEAVVEAVEEAAEDAEGSAAKAEETVEEAVEEEAADATAETPAGAAGLDTLVGTAWAFEDGTEISFKDAETAVIKGGVVALIAPGGLDAALSFEDGNVTISAMGQTKTGTWDGESFEMDGNVATKK